MNGDISKLHLSRASYDKLEIDSIVFRGEGFKKQRKSDHDTKFGDRGIVYRKDNVGVKVRFNDDREDELWYFKDDHPSCIDELIVLCEEG